MSPRDLILPTLFIIVPTTKQNLHTKHGMTDEPFYSSQPPQPGQMNFHNYTPSPSATPGGIGAAPVSSTSCFLIALNPNSASPILGPLPTNHITTPARISSTPHHKFLPEKLLYR
jgi:hypothetical protein